MKPSTLIILLALALAGGCAAPISPAQAKINTEGATNPIWHPFAAENNLINELHPILLWATILGGAAWVVCLGVGMAYPALAMLSKISIVFKSIFIGAGIALILSPWLLWAVLAAVVAIGAVLVEEWIRTKSLKLAIAGTESTFGLPAATSTDVVQNADGSTTASASVTTAPPVASPPAPPIPTATFGTIIAPPLSPFPVTGTGTMP